jgi:hypothetical protein
MFMKNNNSSNQKTYPGFNKKPWQNMAGASRCAPTNKSFAYKGVNSRLLQMYSGKKGK